MQTLDTLFTSYLAEKRPDWAPGTYRHQSLFFRAVLTQFGDRRLDEVTPDFLRAWKTVLGEVYARGTAYRYMHFLSAALHYAVACGWIETHPMTRIRKPSPGPGRVRFLTAEERHRLLLACRMSRNPFLYPLVVIALATGGRKNEVRRLQWSAVDLHSGVVRFLKTKTHLDRTVPVIGDALDELQKLALHQRPSVPWVFPRDDGRLPREMECSWRTARCLAQLEDFRFHDLRHTFASYLAMAGASVQDIATLLGHKRLQQSFIYIHLMPPHTRSVVQAMADKFLRPPGDTP